MADAREHAFEQMLERGRASYAAFHRALTAPGVVDRWVAEQKGTPVRVTSAIELLPRPHPALPLRVLASLGRHAVAGELEFHLPLREGDDPEIGLLVEWERTFEELLVRLVPEAFRHEGMLWIGWRPPPGGPPFAAGRADWPAVTGVAQPFYMALGGAGAPGLEQVAFVLVRDWHDDLATLFSELGIDVDGLLDRLRERADDLVDYSAVGVSAVLEAERGVRDELGLPTSSWTLLLTLARRWPSSKEVAPELKPDVLLHAMTSIVGSRERSDPTPPDASGRPSTAIASDAWTTTDELQHELYADAISRFILDERTRAPLTIGVKAPWGAGKTSLMRMVRQRLDPDGARLVAPARAAREDESLSNREILKTTRLSREQAAEELAIEPLEPCAARTTVWFNAWKYQSGEQLWAGLAHAIVSQVEQRMTRPERERFWASLNIRRLDLTAIRRRIYGAFVLRAIPDLVALPLVGLAAGATWLASAAAGQGLLAGGLALTGADAVRRWQAFASQDVAGSDPKLVADPGYEDRLGFLHLVHEDMRRILALVATPERPLVVFVDDLDRCSYTTVAQVIEALNAFLAGDFEDCLFVIAMEPDLVAAQIHVAYQPLFDRIARLDGPAAGDLGWRFLEKMVQLPLTLPPPDEEQLECFVDSLVSARARAQVGALTDADDELRHARELIREERRGSSLAGIGDAMERARARDAAGRDAGTLDASAEAEPPDARQAAIFERAARIEYAEAFDDAHPEVRALVQRHATLLGGNPREVKRFVNVFRFYAYVQFWRRTAGLPAPELDGAAKLAVLAVRCPHLLGPLGADVRWRGERRCALEWIERGEADGPYEPELLAALPGRLRPELEAPSALLALVRSGPPVGALSAGFL